MHLPAPLLSLHGKIAGMTLLFLIIWGAATLQKQTETPIDTDIQIAIEHQAPASISLSSATGAKQQIIDIANENEETIFLSLPEEWVRTEVRGTSLDAATVEEPSLGYARWTFPPTSSASFETMIPWQSVTILNPTGVLLKVRFSRVNLIDDSVESDVFLIQEKALRIW